MRRSKAPSLTLLLALFGAACSEGTLDPNSDLSELYAEPDSEPDSNGDAGGSDAIDTSLANCPLPPGARARAQEDSELEIPAGDVTKPNYVDSSGFFVRDGQLYDKHGNAFVMRGLNNAHAWFDTGGRYFATSALDDIANYGFNAVRIVWETEAANPSATPELLRSVVECVIALEMVPMIELHDVTGVPQGIAKHVETGELGTWNAIGDAVERGTDAWENWAPLPVEEGNAIANARLLEMAEYYSREDVKQILVDHEDVLLINIANEWSGEDYFGGYSAAIEHLREAGIRHTLVLDANGWGQNADVILEHGQALLDFDPQRNLLFSAHMYESFSANARITEVMEGAANAELPLIIGEFGPEHAGQIIDTAFIFAEAARLSIGTLAWSWKGNGGEVAHLDMAVDWEGEELTPWGADVIDGPNGVRETSLRASVFSF